MSSDDWGEGVVQFGNGLPVFEGFFGGREERLRAVVGP
jgi:hypothetical protein